MNLKLLKIFFLIKTINGFIINANLVIHKEQQIFNEILNIQNLPCHLQSARIKTFESTMEKINRIQINNLNDSNDSNDSNNLKDVNLINIYNVHDLIAFRYVFYTKTDLLKFYHHLKLEKTIMYAKNYINKPKENGYSALHIRYKNIYPECPVKILECQLYIIKDYYNAIYGNSKYFKNYTLCF